MGTRAFQELLQVLILVVLLRVVSSTFEQYLLPHTCQCSPGGAGAPLDLGPLRNTSEGGGGEAIGVDRNAGLIPAKGEEEGRGIGKKALLRRKSPRLSAALEKSWSA